MSWTLSLSSTRALVVGAGALGSPAAGYLVAAGVGLVGLVDPARVEQADLGHELLLGEPDIGASKAERLAARLGALHPEVQIDTYPAELEGSNAEAIISGHGLVVECSNRTETREVVNGACLALGIPLVLGGISDRSGWATTVLPNTSACYCCMSSICELSRLPLGKPASGPLAGIVGSIEALDAIKVLTGAGTPLLDRVVRIDGATLAIEELPAPRRVDCPACAAVESKQEALA